MSQQHNEIAFEDELCAHLADHGWLYSANSAGYDKQRALFPEDILGWLHETQPDELAKIIKPDSTSTAQTSSENQLLDRLVKVLDAPLESGGGTLNVLRKGFSVVNAKFAMCQFRPVTSNNPTTNERYARVRVRVMRQVYYSTSNQKSIDLVLFINGVPVATLELKTDFTQGVQDAVMQYKKARLPKDPVTKKVEPLLSFGRRALVHFAVSNDEVYMTTKLDGDGTFFLPFNRGNDGAAGNPLNPHGSRTAYLWEEVLQRDAWLDIIGKFLHVEVSKAHDPITGQLLVSTSLLFPRYHQWQVVTELANTARAEGPGHKYLVQHSAGSGKTNSIAWTAHRLYTLHDADIAKVFDSVIVITDRTVLDTQLQDAIRQIESTSGFVVSVTGEEAGQIGLASKSALLAKALTDGGKIIVVTIQTFPYALKIIKESAGLASRRFAVVADEAHSSQTGATANQLKETLTQEELAELADGGEIDTETMLATQMTARADSGNISWFAFTATPKARTLELFGRRPTPEDLPKPFHVYTMQQAIEEGFILDVLRNYTAYDTAFQIATKVSKGELKPAKPGETVQSDAVLVDESQATKGLMRWVKLHPTNIAQKVQIIVEHFRANAAHLLEGNAKAMVVTDSRKAAVRYKIAIDAYLAKQGYNDLGTLVAFSGSVEDEESLPSPYTESSFTEANINPRLKGRDLAKAFAGADFRVMLVANKFQTGFSEALLLAMYVDKKLAGVNAVQTLSRLNRIAPKYGKDTSFVLDFVNEPQEILDAFLPYYRDAFLDRETDPNIVHDLRAKLDAAGVYTWGEVSACVRDWAKSSGNNAAIAHVGPARERFRNAYLGALTTTDKAKQDELDLFRKDVSTYVRVYDFLSQIIDYGDSDLEKLAIYLRLLARLIRPESLTQPIDLSDVELKVIKQKDRGSTALDLATGKAAGLIGMTAAGSGAKKDPNMVLLEEVLARINDLFADEDFSAGQQRSFVEASVRTLMEDENIVTQAKANTKPQFLESIDLQHAVEYSVLYNQSTQHKMADTFTDNLDVQKTLIELLGQLVHQLVRVSAA